MNIKRFKQGDIITRTKPAKCVFGEDGSYLGERIIFLGTDKNIIFFNLPDGVGFKKDVLTLSYGRDKWEEGWDYYPEKLYQKALQKVKKVLIPKQ